MIQQLLSQNQSYL